MKFDLCLSLCQAEVDGIIPSERRMYENFFAQVKVADALGYEVAWVGENHFSSRVQQQLPQAVIPHFRGEVALNSDVLHLAAKIFSSTQRIGVGSAIRNIFVNGGPLAHAESIKLFLSVHGLDPREQRRLHLGFASGRFAFSNRPYGILPRSATEQFAWPEFKGKIFLAACEIFLRALRGETLSSTMIAPLELGPDDFRDAPRWQEVQARYRDEYHCPTLPERLPFAHFWQFEPLAVFPFEAPLQLLDVTVATYDPRAQALTNRYLPTKVFNLSFTSPEVIEATHQRMRQLYHPDGGPWQRDYLPRTALIFIDDSPGLSLTMKNQQAKARAEKTLTTYWQAMEGTVTAAKIESEVSNALWGHPQQIIAQIRERFHVDDRLLCWFDFGCHDTVVVEQQMRWFMERVAPHCG